MTKSDKQKLDEIRDVVDRTFSEDADKWEADKQLSLERIERILDEE